MEKGSILPRSKAQVQDKLLKFKPTSMTVEQAREAMLAEAEPVELSRENRVQGKVPQFIQNARERQSFKQHTGHSGGTVQITPEPAERGEGGSAATPVEFIEQPAAPAVEVKTEQAVVIPERQPAAAPAKIRVEDAYRSIELYNNKGEWIADIKYKDGRQPERFKARSKDDLIVKIADGKAHATRKISALTRRIAVGSTYDTWDSYFVRIKKDFGYDVVAFNALSEQTQKMIQQTLLDEDQREFMNTYPNYYGTEDNWKAFLAYTNKHQIPLTFHNLQIAYEDLLAQGVLDLRPEEDEIVAEEVVPQAAEVQPTVASTPAPVVATPVAHSTVEPVAEIPAPAPATPVRKRGSSGLIPGSSSAVPTAPVVAEEAGKEPRVPSEKELKTMDIKELRRAAIPSLNRPSVRR